MRKVGCSVPEKTAMKHRSSQKTFIYALISGRGSYNSGADEY